MYNYYKVGDKVKIRSEKWYRQNKDNDGDVYFLGLFEPFTENMAKYCGRTVTIEKVKKISDGTFEYRIDADNNDYVWNDGMFEDVTVESAELSRFVHHKVGDKVVIRSLDWYSRHCAADGDVYIPSCNRYFVGEMTDFCSQIATIEEVFEEYGQIVYRIDLDNHRDEWCDEMFESDVKILNNMKYIEPKYKRGDKVVIKTQDWYDSQKNEYGAVIIPGYADAFTESMSQYCGETATIMDATQYNDVIVYRIDLDNKYMPWNEGMFVDEEYDEDEYEPEDNEDCISDDLITVSHYKVGDKVHVRPYQWYKCNKDENGAVELRGHRLKFVKSMSKYCGMTATILSVSENDAGEYEYKIDLDNQFRVWNDGMFGVFSAAMPLYPFNEKIEDELDLTDILKNCPKGTPLYSSIFGDVKLHSIDNKDNNIYVYIESGTAWKFCSNGHYHTYVDGECVLFPSADQRDWSKFIPPLKVDMPCMVSDSDDSWMLRYYSHENRCFDNSKMSKDNFRTVAWDYIIPCDKFDFENPDSNKSSKFNYGAIDIEDKDKNIN